MGKWVFTAKSVTRTKLNEKNILTEALDCWEPDGLSFAVVAAGYFAVIPQTLLPSLPGSESPPQCMLGVAVPFLKAGGGREVIGGRREQLARGEEGAVGACC